MTDTPHNEEKEALEDAINRALYGVGTVAITRHGSWVTHDDGTVTGPGYSVSFSAAVAAPVEAPVPTSVPTPTPVPAPSPASGRTPPTFAPADLHWRDATASERVDVEIALDDGTTLALTDADVGLHRMGDVLALVRYADAIVIENPWPASTQNLAGNLKVTVDGAVVFDGRARFDLRTGTRPIRTGLAQFEPADIRDQIGKLLPNFGDPGQFIDLMPKDDGTRYGINGRGPMTYDATGTAGGRIEIGLVPGSDLAYAIRSEQWALARLGADHKRCLPSHMRDPNTGLPLDPTLWPTVSTLKAHLGYKYGALGANPVTTESASPLVPDNSHEAHYGVVPFMATGSDFDMEELLFSASYQATWNNAAYRQYGKAIISGQQTRGIAWGLASYGYAAKLLEGRHPQAAVYRQALRDTVDYYWTQRLAPGKPQYNIFGIFPEFPYADSLKRSRASAPWQNHFLASALDLLVQYGMGEATDWWKHSAAYPVRVCQKVCYQAMSLYCLSFVDPALYTSRAAAEASVAQWYTSWEPVLADSLANPYVNLPGEIGKPCGEMTLNAPTGNLYDGRGPSQSFPANLQPALAAAINAGVPGADEAWAKFQQFCAPNGHIDYTDGAQFNILPRATA